MGRRVEKPWGYELIWAETPHYVGKILVVRKGERLSWQYHRMKDETLCVAEGVVDFEYQHGDDRQVLRLVKDESIHVPKGMRHRVIAVEDARVFEVSTPQTDDIVRLEDAYGRLTSKVSMP